MEKTETKLDQYRSSGPKSRSVKSEEGQRHCMVGMTEIGHGNLLTYSCQQHTATKVGFRERTAKLSTSL